MFNPQIDTSERVWTQGTQALDLDLYADEKAKLLNEVIESDRAKIEEFFALLDEERQIFTSPTPLDPVVELTTKFRIGSEIFDITEHFEQFNPTVGEQLEELHEQHIKETKKVRADNTELQESLQQSKFTKKLSPEEEQQLSQESLTQVMKKGLSTLHINIPSLQLPPQLPHDQEVQLTQQLSPLHETAFKRYKKIAYFFPEDYFQVPYEDFFWQGDPKRAQAAYDILSATLSQYQK